MMVRARQSTKGPEKEEARQSRKSYRFEWSRTRIFLYGLVLLVAFSWMFVLGIFVGRGIPLVSSKDISLKAQFMRFLGLGREPPPAPDDVAATWDDPKDIMESLTYYQDLTHKGETAIAAPSSPGSAAPGSAAAPAPSPSPSSSNRAEQPSAQASANPSSEPPAASTAPEGTEEHYTLLVSSLREVENARRLMEQLRARGYSPRMDSLDLSESGRWNRVLIGSFGSREEALRFAAEFNRKERMEGLVIRETD